MMSLLAKGRDYCSTKNYSLVTGNDVMFCQLVPIADAA